ncbi:MAG: endonuclease, partial [Balneolaceae bacterium]|nr:endonuclease [Balneolaceae bacterium]
MSPISKLIKPIFTGLLFTVCFSTNSFSQSCPAQGAKIFPELSGKELIDAIVNQYGTTDNINYDNARDIMYSQIDSKNNQLTGIYTGYTITLNPDADPSTDAYKKDINAEHAWPQNKGAATEPARSDMHHLYPSYANANSSRGREPFIEIPDSETESWWRNDASTTTPNANFIDEYSERKDGHPSGLLHPESSSDFYDSWEPREDAKGDIARSMFYFYTMYKGQTNDADPNFFQVQKSYLRQWNNSEAVSDKEYQRTCAIAEISGNTVNPFVIDPTLVNRAYFEGQISQTNVGFAATVLNVNENQSTLEIEVSITNPNPDTSTTVDVVYAGGTATAGEDFQTFSTQTLTFPEGSFEQQSITITLLDDEVEEADETILLSLKNIAGPANAGITKADTANITIRDNDGVAPSIVWVNEFHYDNEGGDTGEFVELAVNAQFADLSDVKLTLYNGNGGGFYATYSGNDFVKGETSNGFSFYYVDLPQLQNGAPDGLSLDIDGELIQFLSYEGTFTAADGPAQNFESSDIGVEQTGSTTAGSSLSLTGTGSGYDDFNWTVTDQ